VSVKARWPVRIEIQPKPDGMRYVNMMFCGERPDPEDDWVRAQLEAFPVPPKRVLEWEREGHPYQVWQYGECVIADPLFFIERYKGVIDRIRDVCQTELDTAVGTPEAVRGLIADTALEFHGQARYTIRGAGEMTLSVDEVALRDRLLTRLAEL
jgi:hypothetical protein